MAELWFDIVTPGSAIRGATDCPKELSKVIMLDSVHVSPECLYQYHVWELMQMHKSLQYCYVEVIPERKKNILNLTTLFFLFGADLLYMSCVKYSWLSLSRPRLSRITAYLEAKIWSLPIYENLTTYGKYCRKEEKLLLRSNFSSFPQYFQYISNFKSPITYQFVKCG